MLATVTLETNVVASEFFACPWVAIRWLCMERLARGDSPVFRLETLDGHILHILQPA